MKAVKFGVLLLPLWGVMSSAIAVLPAHAQLQTMRFQCEQGEAFEAQIGREEARVKLASGKTVELLPVDAREGRKFSDGTMLLRVNGEQASIEMKYVMVHSQCLAQESPSTVSSSK